MHRHRVVALLNPPQSPFELACAAEVFGTARPDVPAHYTFRICAERPGPLPTTVGYAMHVDAGLAALQEADTVVIPGWQPAGAPAPPAVTEALRAAHQRGARIAAICTGAFVLAQAGLLDGRRATTHWRHTAQLAATFPEVRVDPDVLYVDHGNVATSAGTGAGIDLCLHLVRSDHGAAYAAQIARNMVLPPHREGSQLQYVAQPAPARADKSLALVGQRLDAARGLLEQTDLPVETIATRVGLASAVNLRRRFRAHLGTYRRTFGETR